MSDLLTATPPTLEAPNWRPHETDKVLLAPFWAGKGSPFPDSTIPYLYTRSKEDHLLRRVFPDMEEIRLPQFIEKLSRWPLVIGFLKATDEVVGYAFLSEYGNPKPYTKANIGFCFFRKYWGRPEVRDLARIALDWFFNKEGVAVLYGPILPWNRISVRFAKELCFQELCRLPSFLFTDKGLEDTLLFCLKREEFVKRFGSRFGDLDACNH